MVPKLEAAAKDEETCRGIIESMDMTLDKGDAYPDECDYGGCTFNQHGGSGEKWYLLMKPGGTELPTCDGKPQSNPNRNRVCACSANAPGRNYTNLNEAEETEIASFLSRLSKRLLNLKYFQPSQLSPD